MSAMQLRTITVNTTSTNTNFQGCHTSLKMAGLSVPTCLKAHAVHQWLHHNMKQILWDKAYPVLTSMIEN